MAFLLTHFVADCYRILTMTLDADRRCSIVPSERERSAARPLRDTVRSRFVYMLRCLGRSRKVGPRL